MYKELKTGVGLVRIKVAMLLAVYCISGFALGKSDPIIANTEILYPFQYRDQQQQLTGYSVAVLQRLSELTGVAHEIRVLPWARAVKNTLNKKNSLIFSIARTPEREAKFAWVGKVAEENAWFWGLKTRFPEPVKDIKSLYSHPIAVTIGTNGAEFVDTLGFTDITRSVDADNSLNMLFMERTHLIIESQNALMERTQRHNLDFNKLIPVYAFKALNSELYFAFNKDSDRILISRFRQALRSLQTSGELQRLRENWGVGKQPSDYSDSTLKGNSDSASR